LELVEAAVADARANADRNGVANCKFFAGRAEALLRVLLERGEVAAGRAVAVVDPPRAGLGREVTQTLRRTEALRRVVYVACDLRQALRNLLDLARPESNQYVGYPFVVRRLVPVDLFPQTPHVEVVALLERCDPELWRQMEEAKVPDAAEGGQHAAGAEGGGQATLADGAEKEATSADGESEEAAIKDSDNREGAPTDGATEQAEPADSDARREAAADGDAQREAPADGDAQREAPADGDAQREAPADGEPREVASANDQPMEAASADT
ncbi:uncharacterized RNA methyltransferase GSU1452-like, partial [Pollicipes pollicipes]|uniref:uncharacterized RNA methyltransferase GSU1452-like n=1 Tax=Pollicipes pollicipes TaxID=41117 RepID=UPI0018852D7C